MELAVTELMSGTLRALRVMVGALLLGTRATRARHESNDRRILTMSTACAGGALLMSALGCEPLDPPLDTCVSVGDTVCPKPDSGISEPVDERYSCLPDGEPVFEPMSPPPPFVSYIVPIVDSANPQPTTALPGLQIRLCQDGVAVCTEAEALPILVAPVPGQGAAVTNILVPFNPRLRAHLSITATGYTPAEYFFGGPLVGAPPPRGGTATVPVPPQLAPMLMVEPGTMITIPTVIGEPIAMVRENLIDVFFQDIAPPGATRDTNAGIIALRMLDCNGNRAPGVSLDMGIDIQDGFGFIVLQNNVPRGSERIELAGPTVPGEAGGAGFANLPPAVYSPFGVLEDGRTYGGNVGYRVQPNGITFGEIRPSSQYSFMR